MKYSWEFKLECVEEYLKGRWKEKPNYAKCSDERFHDKIAEWARLYRICGADSLKHSSSNKDRTAEERYELVAEVLAGRSLREVAFSAEVNYSLLYQWVRRYKLYGFDGLKLKKGRKPKGPVMNRKDETKELTKSEKEELILLRKQNEYLKAENAYLKKLRALIVQKKAESSLKAKKQKSSKDFAKKDTD